jgi:hypothetical protein
MARGKKIFKEKTACRVRSMSGGSFLFDNECKNR